MVVFEVFVLHFVSPRYPRGTWGLVFEVVWLSFGTYIPSLQPLSILILSVNSNWHLACGLAPQSSPSATSILALCCCAYMHSCICSRNVCFMINTTTFGSLGCSLLYIACVGSLRVTEGLINVDTTWDNHTHTCLAALLLAAARHSFFVVTLD